MTAPHDDSASEDDGVLLADIDAQVRTEIAAEAARRAGLLAADLGTRIGMPDQARRPPLRLRYPRWGWRQAITFAVRQRMTTLHHAERYRRYVSHRARAGLTGQQIVLQGMVFIGRRVQLHGRRGHGRLILGPWCWVGDDSRLRAHQGQVTFGAKVVTGRSSVINGFLDVEVGDASILADGTYVGDFDHRFDRLDVPIKDQGIVTSPVRIGRDVWIGEKATVLRGVDVGQGSVIASHALVNTSVPPFSIVAGVPARVVRSRLPDGMDPEEALTRVRGGLAIPGDPIG